MSKDQPVHSFKTRQFFRRWLAKSHKESDGIWLRFFKKDSGVKTITYDEALEEAICVGWIDGQTKSYDDQSWIQKFTPRRARSLWSKRNVSIAKKLIKAKQMKSEGLKRIDEAKKDGRWRNAYDSQKNAEIPEDFLKRLKKNKKAFAFFKTLNRSNLYSIYWKLHTAKKEVTREKRIVAIIEMLTKNKKFQ